MFFQMLQDHGKVPSFVITTPAGVLAHRGNGCRVPGGRTVDSCGGAGALGSLATRQKYTDRSAALIVGSSTADILFRISFSDSILTSAIYPPWYSQYFDPGVASNGQ